MRRLLRSIALAACLLFTVAGCQHNPTAGLLVTRGAVQKQLDAIQADHVAAMGKLRAEQEAVTQRLIAAKDAQLLGAANAFFGQDYVYSTLPSPARSDLVWHALTMEGWTATGKLMPSYETMRHIQERLQKLLDETRTSLADLQSDHAAALAQNQALADATRQFQEQLAALAAKQRETEAAHQAALGAKQAELNEVNSRLIAAEKARSDDAAARQAQLAKLSWGAGILAALCLAGAIWSPVFKQQLGLAAIVLGGAAVAIPFVTGMWLLIAIGAAGLGLIAWAVRKHHKEVTAATGVYRAVQSIKDSASDEYERVVKPKLNEWLTRYDTAGRAVPDQAVQRHIDQRLMEVGDK